MNAAHTDILSSSDTTKYSVLFYCCFISCEETTQKCPKNHNCWVKVCIISLCRLAIVRTSSHIFSLAILWSLGYFWHARSVPVNFTFFRTINNILNILFNCIQCRLFFSQHKENYKEIMYVMLYAPCLWCATRYGHIIRIAIWRKKCFLSFALFNFIGSVFAIGEIMFNTSTAYNMLLLTSPYYHTDPIFVFVLLVVCFSWARVVNLPRECFMWPS